MVLTLGVFCSCSRWELTSYRSQTAGSSGISPSVCVVSAEWMLPGSQTSYVSAQSFKGMNPKKDHQAGMPFYDIVIEVMQSHSASFFSQVSHRPIQGGIIRLQLLMGGLSKNL